MPLRAPRTTAASSRVSRAPSLDTASPMCSSCARAARSPFGMVAESQNNRSGGESGRWGSCGGCWSERVAGDPAYCSGPLPQALVLQTDEHKDIIEDRVNDRRVQAWAIATNCQEFGSHIL